MAKSSDDQKKKSTVRPLVVQMIAKQMAKFAGQRQILTELDQAGMASGTTAAPEKAPTRK